MLQRKSTAWQTRQGIPRRILVCGMGLAAFLLVTQFLPAVPDGGFSRTHLSGLHGPSAISISNISLPRSGPQQSGPVEATQTAAPQPGLVAIQTAIAGVRTPNLQSLVAALGLASAQIGRQAFADSTIGMESISGLAEGESEVAVKWQPSDPNLTAQPGFEPSLYLLSWDGKDWQASYLTSAADALTLQVLPMKGNAAGLFAVIIYRGDTATPYPVIFEFRDHRASLAWDGRSDSSRYTGYDYGSIQFEKTGSGNVPVMVAAGRADPGLLVFPASTEQAGRGFQVATLFAWQNGGYVPIRTEYTQNRDYTIYRFIAALHLHDFKQAYSLIVPGQFLKTDKPSLDLFRKRIEGALPEFTDDKIFEVPEGLKEGSAGHVFILRLGHGKINVYHPTFTSGPTYRLTGLERTASSE